MGIDENPGFTSGRNLLAFTSEESKRFSALHLQLNILRKRLLGRYIEQGNLQGLKFLMEECGASCNVVGFVYAAMEGQLEIVQYILANGCRPDEYWYTTAIERALEYGHPEVANWLTAHR